MELLTELVGGGRKPTPAHSLPLAGWVGSPQKKQSLSRGRFPLYKGIALAVTSLGAREMLENEREM